MQNDSVEFMTKSKFSKLVDATVLEKRLSYMDAVLHLCEKYQIDPSDARKYVSTVVKSKIEAEAQNLNFLPKNNELPI
jgi:hypothetical protein